MKRTAWSALAWLGLLAAILAAAPAGAASYRGKNIDGQRYQSSILHPDFGLYDGVEVKFDGETAYVYFHGGGRLVLTLQDPEIVDLRHIPADDPRRGITWEIRVKELGGR